MSARRSRRHPVDLLARPPGTDRGDDWTALIVDRGEQLAELADLYAKGLLTAEEFETQRAQVLEP